MSSTQMVCGSRDEWLHARRSLITGTDAARIMGLSPYGGPIDVYMEKMGLSVQKPSTDAMEAGRRFERPILEWYADRHNVPITFEVPYCITVSPEQPLIGATLDARRNDSDPRAPVDAKHITYPSNEWGEEGTDEMPVYYAVQLIMQMHVTGADFADLAVVFGNRFSSYRLERNVTVEKDIIDQCVDWWHSHITCATIPDIDGSASATQYLQDYIKQRTDAIIPATPEFHEMAQKLSDVQDELKHLEAQADLYKNKMKEAIGEGRSLVGANWKANWSQSKDSESTDWEGTAYALAHRLYEATQDAGPEIYVKECLKTKVRAGSRRFTFNFK